MLLHPPIAPWVQRRPDGCVLTLLSVEPAFDGLWLRMLLHNEQELLPLRRIGPWPGAGGRWTAWQVDMPWDDSAPSTRYAFKAVAASTQRWLAADGEHPMVPPESSMFRVSRETPPDWVSRQVFYQVFPDRFARGSASDALPADDAAAASRGPAFTPAASPMSYSDRPRPVRQLAWGEPLDPDHAPNSFYGGDLDGIVEHLPHIAERVGATALYLNPVFTAASNHRYDTEDYRQVDPRLGGDAALVRLREATRARSMRLVLDAVLNHTGAHHPWFNRWGLQPTVGAAQSPDSPWRRWYAFDGAGEPIGWKGLAGLPVLDFANPQVRHELVDGPDSVLRHWLRPPFSIDGWRLDVIHMLGEGPGAVRNAAHVRAIRRAIKSENADAYVLGEHFAEATRWLQGDQEDGAMNYHGFTHPVWSWLAGIDSTLHPLRIGGRDLDRAFTRARAVIPYDQQLAQLNLLDSHDSPRFRTLVGGDIARVKLGMTMLFTHPGAPCVYYGDEFGMEGAGDPDCRRCVDWSEAGWERSLLEHVRQLASWRRERADWQRGAWATLAADDDWIVYARYTDRQATVVAVNRGDRAVELRVSTGMLPLPAGLAPDDPMRLRVPARDALIRFVGA